MRIILTGASSFTGYWFAKALAEAGHSVTAPLRGNLDRYEGVRAERVRRLREIAETVAGCPFGAPEFLELMAGTRPDLLCHHAAEVADYGSDAFDVAAAYAANTRALPEVLAALLAGGGEGVVLTGSVFEPGEGAGTVSPGAGGLAAMSPYGLSKAFTAEAFRYRCAKTGVRLGKFVIPNPFGPLEEPRFGHYLRQRWAAGETAEVRTPAYVRDNVPVPALARAYARFVEAVPAGPGFVKTNPSFYVESQGAFAARMAAEFRSRTGRPCALAFARQTEFPEPQTRINTDRIPFDLEDEARFWDDYAQSR